MTGSELGEEGLRDNGARLQELSVEKACEEYNNSVKLTLTFVNQQLDEALLRNYDGLEELSIKIAARTTFLMKNPSFLSCMVYNKNNVKFDPLREFDEIKITLKEHARRIEEKLEEIEKHHSKLLQIVADNGRDEKFLKKYKKLKHDSDDEFQDCLELPSKFDSYDTNSYDKVTIQKNAYTDYIIPESKDPPMLPLFPDIVPEVERGKPHENIHEKLIQQLVQTDSLEGFLKLMGRKPSRRTSKPKVKKGKELERKYTGSLWFFPDKKKITKSASAKCSKVTKNSTCSNLLVTSSQPCKLSNLDRTMRIKQTLEHKKFKCYDLLDDIDHNDVKPIKSEYPRKDIPEPETYLERIMSEGDRVWKKLIQAKELKRKPSLTRKRSKLTPAKAKQVKNLMEYLTTPQPYPKQSLIVMPVKVIYDNFPTKENALPESISQLPTNEEKKSPKIELNNARSVSFEDDKKQKMLEQLRGLKLRNDNIQKNIQKAIDVIESKMIDLLSSPTNIGTQEAFNAMEKEITNVLRMMNENEKAKQLEKKKKAEKKENEIKKTPPKVEPLDLRFKDVKYDPVKKVEAEKDESVKISILKSSKLQSFATPPRRPTPLNLKPESGDNTVSNERPKDKTISTERPKDKTISNERSKSLDLKPKNEIKKANIEEGEKILGQVDNVIKKIDNIYNKFNEEIKPKKVIKKESSPRPKPPEFTWSTMSELKYSEVSESYQVIPTYHQSRTYFPVKFETLKSPTNVNRHVSTLRNFYLFFFTSLFIALNFDYVS